jgi:large subunit ribosomal protein L9
VRWPAGDLVEVKDGYARNYLVPQGLAVVATKGIAKQAADIKRARGARGARDLTHAQEIAAALGSLKITLTARAGTEGRLFGSVTTADVVAAVTAAGGPKLDKRTVVLAAPIKSTGSADVSVTLHPEVTTKLTLTVAAGA